MYIYVQKRLKIRAQLTKINFFLKINEDNLDQETALATLHLSYSMLYIVAEFTFHH